MCELYALESAMGRMSKKLRRAWEKDLLEVLEWSAIPTPGPTQPSHRWHFDTIPHETLVAQTRFAHEDICRIYTGLRVPAVHIANNRTKFTGLDGLLIVLYRLGNPGTLFSLTRDLDWQVAELDVIFNHMLEHVIHPRIAPLLREHSPWLRAEHLQRSAELIARRFGLPVPLVMAFIDGKVFHTCRPKKNQRCVWCGKDRCHGLKWQNLIDAFGISCHFYGGHSARVHDAWVYNHSGLYAILNRILGERLLCVYGDAAYPRSDRLLKPYLGPTTEQQRAFNRWYSVLRVVVEWSLGKIVALWPIVNFKPKMKILLSRITPMVEAAAFFTNCHTLLYGSQVSQYFGVRDEELPALEEYFV